MSGVLVVISGPSGAGKTTICKLLAKRHNDFVISVSCTTRNPGAEELDGVDYNFITNDEFTAGIRMKAYIEYEIVYGCYYGTRHTKLAENIAAGKTVLLDIDVNGAIKIQELYPDTVSFFIDTRSPDVLERRLIDRGRDTLTEIKRRLEASPAECRKKCFLRYHLTNDLLIETVDYIDLIIVRHQIAATDATRVLANQAQNQSIY